MALNTIGEARDISLVRQMLQAYTIGDARVDGDLVILNEEAGGYEQHVA